MVKQNYSYCNDVAAMKKMMAEDKRYEEIYRRCKSFSEKKFEDDYRIDSGWWHNFACPYCAEIYPFVMSDHPKAPGTYTCPRCGRVSSGEEFDAAWMFSYRNTLCAYLEGAVTCLRFGDKSAGKYIDDYMDYYATHYRDFRFHGKWVGKARVMAQTLDESTWGINVLRILLEGKELFPEEKLDFWYRGLFRPMAEELFPQAQSIHNISLWVMCCIGAIGVFFGDRDLMDKAIESEYGIRNQIRKGFTKDGLWRECSINYHYYVAQALVSFFPVYATVCKDDPMFDIFEKIFVSPLAFSEDGHHLQAINDGWYPQDTDRYLWMEAAAARLMDHPRINHDVNEARKSGLLKPISLAFDIPEMLDENGLDRDKQQEDIFTYPYSNFGFIRKPFLVILRSGVICSTHMHMDYLSIMIPPFSDDLGTPAYSHPLMNSWYKEACAHNTISIDGGQPFTDDRDILHTHVEKTENGVRAVVEQGEWDDVLRADRTLIPDGDSVLDTVNFECGNEHTFDFVFHSFGSPEYSSEGTKVPSLDGGLGYTHFQNIEKREGPEQFKAVFRWKSKKLVLELLCGKDTEVYTMQTPSNPPDEFRNTVLFRQKGRRCHFEVKYTVKEQ